MSAGCSEVLPPRPLVDMDQELQDIAQRYRRAGRSGVQYLATLGVQGEALMRQLPEPARAGVELACRQGLRMAVSGASYSQRLLPAQSASVNRLVGTGLGAVGGLGGLPGALIELPLTTAFLMRMILEVAQTYGFDPRAETTRFEAAEVFSSAGPLSHDDGAETGLWGARIGLAAGGAQQLAALLAPRLAAAFGPKVAAQLVPVLGAATGGGLNYLYTGYYQEMAHVQFALRRLSVEADRPYEALLAEFRQVFEAGGSGR